MLEGYPSAARASTAPVLTDNPTARDLATLLPLKLTEESSSPFGSESAGDLCYLAPWGNLALFHAGYRYSPGLTRIGRFETGYDALLTRGEFRVSIDRVG